MAKSNNNNNLSKEIDEFIKSGGQIEKLPTVKPEDEQVQSATTYKVPQLYELHEAQILFGEDRSLYKTNTKDEITHLLTTIVKRNPKFLSKHKIPQEYIDMLPKEVISSIRSKKIDSNYIPDDIKKSLAKTNPQVLIDMGINPDDYK